jgi:hypothetical protein
VQPAQEQTSDDTYELFAVAWQVVLKVLEPELEKASPGSFLVYKVSDKLAASPSLTPDGRKFMNLIKVLAFLHGLDKSKGR